MLFGSHRNVRRALTSSDGVCVDDDRGSGPWRTHGLLADGQPANTNTERVGDEDDVT